MDALHHVFGRRSSMISIIMVQQHNLTGFPHYHHCVIPDNITERLTSHNFNTFRVQMNVPRHVPTHFVFLYGDVKSYVSISSPSPVTLHIFNFTFYILSSVSPIIIQYAVIITTPDGGMIFVSYPGTSTTASPCFQ